MTKLVMLSEAKHLKSYSGNEILRSAQDDAIQDDAMNRRRLAIRSGREAQR